MNSRSKKSGQIRILKIVIVVFIIVLAGVAGMGLLSRSGKLPEISGPKSVKTVLLDPGHDAAQPGNVGLIAENEYAEAVCAELETLLDGDESFKVIRTHTAEESLPVSARKEMAEGSGADMLISIHAVYDPFAEGSCPRISLGAKTNPMYSRSLKLAGAIQKELKNMDVDAAIGTYYFTNTYGDKYAFRFVNAGEESEEDTEVMDLVQLESMPVVVVECVNVNCAEDVEKLASEEGVKAAATAIYNALKAGN